MPLELKTEFKGLRQYQTYPDIFDFNYMEKCDIPESFESVSTNIVPTTKPTSTNQKTNPTNIPIYITNSNPTDIPVPIVTKSPFQSTLKKGDNIPASITGIVLGLFLSIILFFYSFYLLNDEVREEASYNKYIVLFISVSILAMVMTIYIMTYQRINLAINAFNCQINTNIDKNINDTNSPFYTVNNLNLDDSILKRLNISKDAALCQDEYNYNKGYKYSPIPSRLCPTNLTNFQNYMNTMKMLIAVPILMILIISYGVLFKEDFFEFVTNSAIRGGLIFLLMISMIGLISSLYTNISSNKLAFYCNDLGSVRNRLDSVAMTDNRIMSNEETIINSSLNKLEFNDSALICNDNQTNLQKFEKTSNTFNGILLFVYIVVGMMLLFLTILLISQSNFTTSIFNLDEDIGSKIMYLILLTFVLMTLFVSIIYPSVIGEDYDKPELLTGLMSSLIPSFFVILSTIFTTIIG